MKILLIIPPLSGEERYGKLARSGTYLPPLGLAYLAAVLERDHDIRIIDGSVLDISVEDIAREIAAWRPGLVGISAITPTIRRAGEICGRAKKIDPAIVTVLGGPHPTAAPDDTLRNASVDVVVSGEGEETFKELVQTLESGRDLSLCDGIHYRKNGAAMSTKPRKRITDLDALPFPARHLLPMDRYRPSPMHYKRLPAFSIMCGRGCPFRCTFCSCSKVFHGKVTMRSPENIIAEIRSLTDRYGAREILIWDDIFGLRKDWTKAFCDLITPLGVTWSAWMRVDTVDRATLGTMAESGCWHVSYGVESGNQRVLDTIRKGFTVEQVKNAFRWTRECGMEARGTFILGLPNDTWDTMMDTIDLAIEIRADYAQFQFLTPYPGTEFWDSALQYGTVLTDDLSKYTIWHPVFVPQGLTSQQLVQAHRLAYRRFYFRPSFVMQKLSGLRTWEDLRRNAAGFLSLLGHSRR